MVSWGHQSLLGSDGSLAERVVPTVESTGSHLLPFMALHWACGPGLCPKDKGQLSQAPQGISKDMECMVSFSKSPPGALGPHVRRVDLSLALLLPPLSLSLWQPLSEPLPPALHLSAESLQRDGAGERTRAASQGILGLGL